MLTLAPIVSMLVRVPIIVARAFVVAGAATLLPEYLDGIQYICFALQYKDLSYESVAASWTTLHGFET